jgi:hypothetical protein
MILTNNQVSKANNFFKQILATDPEILEEKGLLKCKKCDGTGLGGIKKLHKGGYSWDPLQYCDKCYGVGFLGMKNINTFDEKLFICGECNGVGCRYCDQTGFTDWIAHAMGR